MAERTRIRRPQLDRTTAIRNWSSVVSPVPDPPDTPVGQDVHNANRVVEEYLRAGEASARLFQRAATGSPGFGDGRDMAQWMVRATSDLMTFWMEMFARSAAFVPPAGDGIARSASSSPPPREAAAAGSLQRMSIEVRGGRPVKVTVDLRQDVRHSRLRIGRLHSVRPRSRPLTTIELDRDGEGTVGIRLNVDAEQPPGVYTGAVVDEDSSSPAGTITVELLSPRATRGRRSANAGRRRR